MPTNSTCCRTLGTHSTSRQDEMAAFDMLPAEVRTVLRDAPYKFSAKAIVLAFRRGVEIEQVLRLLPVAVGKYLADTEMFRTWGAHHPQAVVTGRARRTLKELGL